MRLSPLPGLVAAALAAAALGAGPASASQSQHPSFRPAPFGPYTPHRPPVRPDPPSPRVIGTVFAQTDGVAGNSVVAYDRLADGSLRQAGTYPTGGLGGVLDGSVVDHTASQGALTLDGGLLYAVNAGSNTITVFDVDGDRLVRQQVLPSGGSFPVSVAAHRNLVYVLNARDGGTVQGYLRIGGGLVPVASWHRLLGLDPNATPEFTTTPGQVAFTPHGHRLIVTTKANTSAVEVFDVNGFGGLSPAPVTTVEPGAVPFAVAFDQLGHLAIAEAGTNALATFAIDHADNLVALDNAPTGQAATCWVVIDHKVAYVSNAGSGTLSSYRIGFDGHLTALATTPTDGGTVDATISSDGRDLYVQTGAAGIVDAFRIGAGGALTPNGSVTVPDGVGGEGIAAS